MNFELTKDFIDVLVEVIDRGDEQAALTILEPLHSADIAEICSELSIDQAKFLYLLLDGEKAADVLMELDEDDRQKFLKAMPSDVIARQFIDNMDSDDAADLIGELEDTRKNEVLSHIDDLEQAGDIVDLLNYHEDTAGGLMAKELLAVNENWSMPTCLNEMRRQAEEIGEIYYVYVVNDDNVLTGILPLKKMLLSPSVSKVKNVMDREIIKVRTDADSEEVAQIMEKYNIIALPVVDFIGRLVGRITIDDVVDVIREEAEKDYQLASGITEDVETSDTIFRLTRARIPWLLIGLFGGIMAALILGVFEGEISIRPQIAFFIPLIAAMGGNVGIQSSAIVVQSLAAGTHNFNTAWERIGKEFGVAFVNASVLSGIILTYNLLTHNSHALTYSVSISLFSVIIFASFFGTIIPLTLDRFNIDPAVATGPFITTTNDIFGLLIYLKISGLFFAV